MFIRIVIKHPPTRVFFKFYIKDAKRELKKYPTDLSAAIRKISRLIIETTARARALRRLIARSGDEFSGTNEHLAVSL